MKLQIHEKCFLLSSLWVYEVLWLEYLQNYAVLILTFIHLGNKHLIIILTRVKHSFYGLGLPVSAV